MSAIIVSRYLKCLTLTLRLTNSNLMKTRQKSCLCAFGSLSRLSQTNNFFSSLRTFLINELPFFQCKIACNSHNPTIKIYNILHNILIYHLMSNFCYIKELQIKFARQILKDRITIILGSKTTTIPRARKQFHSKVMRNIENCLVRVPKLRRIAQNLGALYFRH